MVCEMDISLLLKMFYDRSKVIQIFNLEWGDLSEAALFAQDDPAK
jgi:hypothetical protein